MKVFVEEKRAQGKRTEERKAQTLKEWRKYGGIEKKNEDRWKWSDIYVAIGSACPQIKKKCIPLSTNGALIQGVWTFCMDKPHILA